MRCGSRRLDHGEREAQLYAGRRNLLPDEARADHNDTDRRPGEISAKRLRIIQGTKNVYAGQIGAWKPAWTSSGRNDNAIERFGLTRVEAQRTGCGIQRRGSTAKSPLDVGQNRLLAQCNLLRGVLAPKQLLGQRRPIVRGVHLIADDDQTATETTFA
jgi:hypothetical protein